MFLDWPQEGGKELHKTCLSSVCSMVCLKLGAIIARSHMIICRYSNINELLIRISCDPPHPFLSMSFFVASETSVSIAPKEKSVFSPRKKNIYCLFI